MFRIMTIAIRCGVFILCCAVTPVFSGEVADCNGNGRPDDQDIAAPPAVVTYQSGGGTPIPGNDPNGVSSTITVTDVGVIDDVNVRLHIDHQAQGDLRATLTHNGVTVIIINRAGSNANACGPSIYGYFADNYGSPGNPLLLDDETGGPGIDCYAGPGATWPTHSGGDDRASHVPGEPSCAYALLFDPGRNHSISP